MRKLLTYLAALVAVTTISLGLVMVLGVDARAQYDPEVRLSRQLVADQGLFFGLAENNINGMAVSRDQGADPNVSLSRLGLKPETVFGKDLAILKQPFNSASWPILTWAVYLGRKEAVNLLLRAGARVNSPDEYGATALHWAAQTGRYDIATVLLNNGASCYATDFKGATAKDWAMMSSQYDLVRLIDGRSCRVQPIGDEDQDGVPDDRDQCPGTPLGAPVDERGCWIVAYAAFFDFDKSVIKSEYLPHIQQAARVLANNPTVNVRVVGHTDYVGTEAYNYGLGLRRAQSVIRELVRNGVSPARLSEDSRGESEPIESNTTRAGRARNRRVEIHVDQQVGISGVQ
ncbi:MAG: ankyrin repeat domain-containing protein [Deltaproteobacteria bacterium]|jgi:outer membrane protein OmpA-like peptidoglycan-associated protein|nr:ankyrin repeat domain-containing protein [Deltaproteobacteria bacterium]